VGQETVVVDNLEPVDLGCIAVVHQDRPRPSTVFVVGRGIGLVDAGEVGKRLVFHYCSPC